MKIAVWTVFFLLVALWTGGTLLLTELTQWGARQLASGEAVALGQAVAQWPVPAWATAWLDTAWIQAAQGSLAWALQTLNGALPALGSSLGWIVPLIWVLWGLGVVVVLVLAGGAHVLLGRVRPAAPRAV